MDGCVERGLLAHPPALGLCQDWGLLLGDDDLDVALAVAGDVAAVGAADGDVGGEGGIEGATLHRELLTIHLTA